MTNSYMNVAKCTKCGDVLVSMYRHDFQRCKCTAIFIDGGNDYGRAGFDEASSFSRDVSEEEIKVVVERRKKEKDL